MTEEMFDLIGDIATIKNMIEVAKNTHNDQKQIRFLKKHLRKLERREKKAWQECEKVIDDWWPFIRAGLIDLAVLVILAVVAFAFVQVIKIIK